MATNFVTKVVYNNQTILCAFWVSAHVTTVYWNESGSNGWRKATQQL